MTRTITTAAELDALPWGAVIERTVFGEHAEDWHKRRDGMWLCGDGDILTAEGLVRFAERRNAALVPAPSVVPEVAVEAATAAVRRERAFAAAAAFGVPLDAVPQCAEMIAYAALTAALPHLTAPSATERIARTLAETTALSGADAHRVVQAAQAMSAPGVTREDVKTLVGDIETEADNAEPEKPDAHREGVVAGLREAARMARARFTITERADR